MRELTTLFLETILFGSFIAMLFMLWIFAAAVTGGDKPQQVAESAPITVVRVGR